jgi:PAS domain S-box-containing protein
LNRDSEGKSSDRNGLRLTPKNILNEEQGLSDREFRAISDSFPQISWVTNEKGVIRYSNKMFFSYTGLSESEDIMLSWQKIVPADEMVNVQKLWSEAIASGQQFQAQYRIRRFDGQYRWHLVRTTPLKNEVGSITKWFGTATDIHEKVVAEERIQFLAEAGTLLFSSLDYSITLQNLSHLAVSRLCDWCGIDIIEPGSQIPHPIALSHPDPQKMAWGKELVEKFPTDWNSMTGAPNVIRTGRSELYATIDEELLRKATLNEEHLHLIMSLGMKSAMIVPLTASGKTVGAMTLISAESGREYNSSDLVFAEDLALRAGLAIENARLYSAAAESEHQFRVLANSIPHLAWIAHGDGFIFWYNERWYNYTGTSFEDQQGWGWQAVHHPDELPRVIAVWKKSIETGEEFELEFPIKGADGKFRWFLTRSTPIKNSRGQVVRWFGTNTEIEDQKDAQRKLELAVKLRDDFLSIASHELKTPITSLRLQLQIARRGIQNERQESAASKKLTSSIDTSIHQVDRLITLVEDLLDVSRIQAGRLNFNLNEHFYLAELVQSVVSRFSEDLGMANCLLAIEIDPEIEVAWDRSRIDQVFSNLISNVIKYAPQSLIEIKAKIEGENVICNVRDFGPGIPKERQSKIFERFERANASRNISGMGLGLFIVQQIVRGHLGSIKLESDVGMGANFVIQIPQKPNLHQVSH